MPFDLYMKAIPFALGTPNRCGNSSNGWQLPAPREFHPRQVLCRLLSLLEAVTEQEYR